MIKDYYKILGITIAASQTEIKSVFRKLAVFWHPDRNSNPIALQKMQELNEAYEILSDEDKRKVYDRIYREYFFINDEIVISHKKETESVTKEKEEYIKQKYDRELNELYNWIKNIKFSLSSIDDLLNKVLVKIDRPIETFFYFLPIVIVISLLSFIVYFIMFKMK